MNTLPNFAIPLCLAAAFSLCGCESSTGGGGAGDSSTSAASSRFGVTDSVVGRWKGIPGTSSASDTFSVTKDSLVGIWSVTSGTVGQTLKPYSDAKFYAHGGRMGLTNGMTVSDNVTFEYVFSGDTLFVELMGSLAPDGKVDRTASGAFFTHGWLRR